MSWLSCRHLDAKRWCSSWGIRACLRTSHALNISGDGRGFAKRFNNFLAGLDNRAEYDLQLADLTEHNPLLVIDFLRRAWTLNDDPSLPIRARQVWSDSAAEVRAKSAVESLMLSF